MTWVSHSQYLGLQISSNFEVRLMYSKTQQINFERIIRINLKNEIFEVAAGS